MRGQFAVELFLIVSLVSLVLFWMGNYANEWQNSASTLTLLQENTLASSVARMVNRAGNTGANITYQLPCLRLSTQSVVYNLSASGATLQVSTYTPNVSATAQLAFTSTGSMTVGCSDSPANIGSAICINPSGGTVNILNGACA